MIEINNLSITHRYDQIKIINDFNFILHKGDKVALIGEEGNGKSTLLKALFDQKLIEDYCDITGNIQNNGHKLAYLPQDLSFLDSQSIYEFFLTLPDFFAIDPKALIKVTKSLHLDIEDLYSERKWSTLSGGQKIRYYLAWLVFNDADVYLLDEPGNNLDLKGLHYLEDFIKHAGRTVIFVSHDETLIQNTANIIIHLEKLKKRSFSKFNIYKGNYHDYLKQRERAFIVQDKNAAKEKEEYQKKQERYNKIYNRVNFELNNVSRQDPHSGYLLKKKMHSVKALEKRLDKEKKELTPFHDEEKAILLKLPEVKIPPNKKIIDLHLDALKINDRILAKNLKLSIYGPKKVAIIGDNGVGKTTLLKRIIKEINPDLRLFYMPQNYEETMDFNLNAIDFIIPDASPEQRRLIRNALGSIKFKDDEMLHKIRELSGGQKAKLFFTKIYFAQSEVLLMDEPTRNFSPLSSPVIREMLKNYGGAIICISHDRKLLQEIFDELYMLTADGLIKINDF